MKPSKEMNTPNPKMVYRESEPNTNKYRPLNTQKTQKGEIKVKQSDERAQRKNTKHKRRMELQFYKINRGIIKSWS